MNAMIQVAFSLSVALAVVSVGAGSQWRHFRGTDNQSVSLEENLPKSFDDGRNVAWKVALPGRGPSSPIVVDNKVAVTCSTGVRQDRLHVLVFDTRSGELIWQRQLWATGHTQCNSFSAVADNTPASDGRRIFVFYSSNDLACFDLQGNLNWFRGLAYERPGARNDVGMASSPLVACETVIVQVENQGDSFALGLDAATGETRWRLQREQGATWTSPTVMRGKTPDADIVLLQSRSRLTAHRPRTGEQLWEFPTSCHTIASVTTWGDVAYLPANGLGALKYDSATGRVKLLWHAPRLRSGNSSPVVFENRAYVLKPPGIVVCGDTKDGTVLWQLRLKGPFWSTPLVADGHLVAVNHGGLVQTVRLGEKGELVGTSQIEEGILASPAVAGGAIYFRSDAQLWKVSFAESN
jgi:outer membrane protein assembly factor BamB